MSSHRTVVQAFGEATSGLVEGRVPADVLAQLIEDCVELTSADAVALLVLDRNDELSLLASSSHRAAELEILQIQRSSGPCVDGIASGKHEWATGADEISRRWEEVGPHIVEAGFQRVDAYPMRWRGRVLGGLNIFRRSPAEVDEEADALAQAFSDVATLVVVQSTEIPADQIAARVHEAIMARSQIEMAKGVLAQVHGIDMGEAYEQLRRQALSEGRTITETADAVVSQQHTR